MTENSSGQGFYPLTASVLEKLYRANLSAAEWRLWTYLSTLDPWGDRYADLPDIPSILEKISVKKSTFYKAIAKFQELELFDFQSKGFEFRNLQGSTKVRTSTVNTENPSDRGDFFPKTRNEFQENGKLSEISENLPKIRNEFQENGKLSKDSENQPLEPLQGKSSEASQTIQTLQTFSDSLSERERESFFNFAREKAKNLPKPPALIQKWIEKNWEELGAEWSQSSGQAPKMQSSQWQNHPQREQWLAEIEASGNPALFADTKEKQDFIIWAAETKQYSWLKEEG